MMVASLFIVICTCLLSEVYSVEILSTTVDTPEINDTEGVTKINCLLKNVHKGNVMGACASLGNVCSLAGYRNKSTNRKQLGCECLQNVIHNIDQIIAYSLGKLSINWKWINIIGGKLGIRYPPISGLSCYNPYSINL